jgi:hypothetical protein
VISAAKNGETNLGIQPAKAIDFIWLVVWNMNGL